MVTSDEPDDDDLEVPASMRDINWATATDEQRAEMMEFLKCSMEDMEAGRVVDAIEFLKSLRLDEGGAGEKMT